jgi:hypothetical protein
MGRNLPKGGSAGAGGLWLVRRRFRAGHIGGKRPDVPSDLPDEPGIGQAKAPFRSLEGAGIILRRGAVWSWQPPMAQRVGRYSSGSGPSANLNMDEVFGRALSGPAAVAACGG